jgi:hypothetical protein
MPTRPASTRPPACNPPAAEFLDPGNGRDDRVELGTRNNAAQIGRTREGVVNLNSALLGEILAERLQLALQRSDCDYANFRGLLEGIAHVSLSRVCSSVELQPNLIGFKPLGIPILPLRRPGLAPN